MVEAVPNNLTEFIFISILKYSTLGICCFIFFCDILRRANKKYFWAKSNNYEKWINIFSLLTLFLCIIRSIMVICGTLPIICKYITWKTILPNLIVKVFFTYFMITGLIHCNPNTSKTYKNICCYFILYFTGFIIIICLLYMRIFVLNVDIKNSSAPSGKYGCFIKVSNISEFVVFVLGTNIIYYLWNLLCLFLYGMKLYALTTNEKDIEIRIFLNKMVVLNVVYTIIGTFTNPIFILLSGANISSIAVSFLRNLDILSSLIIMYLMIEGNKKHYDRIIKSFLKSTLCCCGLCKIGFIRKRLKASITKELERNSEYVQSYNNSSSRPSNINPQITETEIELA